LFFCIYFVPRKLLHSHIFLTGNQVLAVTSFFLILLETLYTTPFEVACMALKMRFALLNYNLKNLFLCEIDEQTNVLLISTNSKRILKHVMELYDKLTDCVSLVNSGLSFFVI
jgi:hypothetical protein